MKGIFDKILEFFSLILTGIVLNAAFKWLQKEENREKLFKIFDFIGDAFVPFIITVLSVKVLGKLLSIFNIARKIAKIGNSFRRKPPSLPGNLCNQIAQCFGNPAVVTSPIKSPSSNPVTSLAPTLFPGGIPKPIPGQQPAGQSKKQYDWLNPLLTAGAAVAGFIRFYYSVIGTSLSVLGIDLNKLVGGARASRGGTMPGTIAQGKKCDTCSLGFSAGGSVYGKGSANVDSVSAMLAPGEEVIRTSSASMFRPLLKDINDNAGRLWSNFSLAVNKLGSVTAYQEDVSDEFYKTIQELDKNLKDEILRRKVVSPMGVGGFGMRSMPKSQVKPSPKRMNIPMKSKRSGGMSFIPFTLPTQKSAPPQMPEIKSGQETESPQVSSVNTLDPYVMTTAEKYYGIFVG